MSNLVRSKKKMWRGFKTIVQGILRLFKIKKVQVEV